MMLQYLTILENEHEMKRELQQHSLLIYIILNTATSANWQWHNAHYNEGDSYTGELCKLLTSRCFQVREQSGPASLAHEVHHKCLTSGGCGSPCSWHGNLHGFCKHTERGVCVCCLKNVMWCDLCMAYLDVCTDHVVYAWTADPVTQTNTKNKTNQ